MPCARTGGTAGTGGSDSDIPLFFPWAHMGVAESTVGPSHMPLLGLAFPLLSQRSFHASLQPVSWGWSEWNQDSGGVCSWPQLPSPLERKVVLLLKFPHWEKVF